MRRILVPALSTILLWLPGGARAQWTAGVAEGKITPPMGTPMAGFAARKQPAQGVHDDIYFRALVVERGGAAIALATVDLVGVDRQTADAIRAEVSRRTSIPAGRILISATHTHSGPVVRGAYRDTFIRTAEETFVQAWQSRKPARIGTDTVTHRGWVGMNRRHLESGFSPVDKRISILKVCDPQGRIEAVLFNYSCHAACLGPDNLNVSADWPYFTIRRIKGALGEDVKVLFFQGTEGNVNTGYSAGLSAVGVPIATRNFAYAQEAGEVLADAILGRVRDIPAAADGPLEARDERVNLDYYVPSGIPEADARLAQAREALRAAEDKRAPETQVNAARVNVAFAEYNRARIERNLKQCKSEYSAEMQAFRIGDAGFVSFPGEFFVEIGLEVKRLSPFPTTFCLGLANESIGYIPIPEAYPEGGYEVSVAQFGPSTAGRWENAAARLLKSLAGGRPAQ
jgi:neutral ceramidase